MSSNAKFFAILLAALTWYLPMPFVLQQYLGWALPLVILAWAICFRDGGAKHPRVGPELPDSYKVMRGDNWYLASYYRDAETGRTRKTFEHTAPPLDTGQMRRSTFIYHSPDGVVRLYEDSAHK